MSRRAFESRKKVIGIDYVKLEGRQSRGNLIGEQFDVRYRIAYPALR